MAAANSNTATRHILQGALYLTLRNAENVSLRVSDALQFGLTKRALVNAINPFNVYALQEIAQEGISNFGIFLELEPDEEDKAKLEQNIQIALQSGGIDLEDAIDIREIKNIKLANQAIKQKRARKEAAEHRSNNKLFKHKQQQMQKQQNVQLKQICKSKQLSLNRRYKLSKLSLILKLRKCRLKHNLRCSLWSRSLTITCNLLSLKALRKKILKV